MQSTTAGNAYGAGRNPWITRVAVGVFLALAVGMILWQGPGRALGYGAPAPTQCGGYHTVCQAQVASVNTNPNVPTAGKGFTVGFTTNSGGKYVIKSRRSGATKSVTLSSGVAGTGRITVRHLGKKLRAGAYTVSVTVASTVNASRAKASHKIRIKRP